MDNRAIDKVADELEQNLRKQMSDDMKDMNLNEGSLKTLKWLIGGLR